MRSRIAADKFAFFVHRDGGTILKLWSES